MALPSQPAWFGLAWLGFDNINCFSEKFPKERNVYEVDIFGDLFLPLLVASRRHS